MQRYFTEKELSIGQQNNVESDEAHHMKNVMRFRVDDTFEMVDSKKSLYICKVVEVNSTITYEAVSEKNSDTELPVKVTVVCPLLKGEKFDWMLQKATELGAAEFIIYEADRSIVKLDEKKRHKRMLRFEKIIKEASEQSKRLNIPQISYNGKLDNLNATHNDPVFWAFEGLAEDETKSLKHFIHCFKEQDSLIFVFGPEGGFSEREIGLANTFTPVRLGTRILRAETAPLYFLSAVSFAVD